MAEILRPDICVIGAGSAGLTVAAAAAAFGVSVVLVEGGRMGGDCLNTGCVPSKSLIAAARHAHTIRRAPAFGVMVGEPEIDFQRVHDHVHGVIAAIAPNDSAERFAALGVKVIRAHGRFTGRRTLEAEDYQIRARRFVVATGSRPRLPAVPGLDTVPYLTNETIFDLTRPPGHLVIIGGGPIGMELAQAFARLGSSVTVLESSEALGHDDPELAALAIEAVERDGVVLREGVSIVRAARRGRYGIRVSLSASAGEETIDGTHLLVAVGRQPDIAELGLEAARIAHSEKGIKVNRRLRTTNRRVYAIGDAVGGYQFTHWAGYQAGLVVRSILFRFGGRMKPGLVPWVTYTDPELAHVGLSEEEARQRFRTIRILRWPFAENDRAQTERATAGLVKAIVTRKGRIVGAGIVGAHAGELIAPWALAISQGLTVRALMDTVLPYPTLSETAKRAALSFYTPKLMSPWPRRLVRLARLLP
ncbi:MAG TPA: FAD-dependent oxidoreductase [Afifellaceae bacterium]|nr:FAD-dependent oxidoreductase [Afifellaceae bacterium]